MRVKNCTKCGKQWVADPKKLICPDCGTKTLIEIEETDISPYTLKSRHKALPHDVLVKVKMQEKGKQQEELEQLLKRLDAELEVRGKIIQVLVDMGYLTLLINVVLALLALLPAVMLLLTNTSSSNYFDFSFVIYESEFVLFRFKGIFFLLYILFLAVCVILSAFVLKKQNKNIFKEHNLGLSIGSWLVYFESRDSRSVLILIMQFVIINGAISMWSRILFETLSPNNIMPFSSVDLDPEDFNEIFGLLNASVYEEIISRFALIGIPAFCGVLVFSQKRKELGKSVFWKAFVGGFGMKPVSKVNGKTDGIWQGFLIFLIIGSAIIFGLNHVPSWGWWKFGPTFLTGLFLGYLYVEFGIHAAILLHFFIDFPLVSLTLAWEFFIWGMDEGMLNLLGFGPFYILFYLTILYLLYGSLSLFVLWPIVTIHLSHPYYDRLRKKNRKKDKDEKIKKMQR
ncbi:MAG: CPBP family intramembrane glutamic endopeptidase [Promethearchaeota archaeon]